jgi:hypothetical protein
MYINAILSSMGAWDLLTEERETLFQEISDALARFDVAPRAQGADPIQHWHQALNAHLAEHGWDIGTQISLMSGKHTFYTLDFIKQGVGGKLVMGKQAFVLTSLLAHFPLSVQLDDFELGVVLMPMHALKPSLPGGTADYEATVQILEELSPLLIRYPYLVIGFSALQTPLQVTELTSELDQFLLQHCGYTLNEVRVLGEKPAYDFKRCLPEKIENITKEVCAMANLPGGGILLFGIGDDGEIAGIDSGEIDTAKLRITGSVRSLLDPIPTFEFQSFELNDDSGRTLLVCRIEELKRKPCLLHSRAYIRSGPSAQTADAGEIRRLVLGSAPV